MPVEFYYHPQSPASCIVWMVLKELDIPHTAHLVDLMKKEQKADDFKKLNPNMQVPTIKDGDLVLSQSRAIVMYLCKKYEKAEKQEKLFPTDDDVFPQFMALLFRDIDNLHSILNYLNREAIFMGLGQAKGPNEALLPKAVTVLAEYEELLSKNDYVFGKHLTLLDYFFAHTVAAMAWVKFDKWDNYPNMEAWKGRLQKLPYFEECIKQPMEKTTKLYQDLLEKGPAAFTDLQKK